MSDNEEVRTIAAAHRLITEYYAVHGRHDLPWRQSEANGQFDPYKIMVSELMLQQTQVSRVVPKFTAFLSVFPNVTTLAAAPLGAVLAEWSGLGYNRRAKFLWQAAQTIMQDYAGGLPKTAEQLVHLPGIGPNTAGAILAYAFNQPALFIETNIRSVFIHHFFSGQDAVRDAEITSKLAAMLAAEPDPRTFYWAVMDYGTYLKQTVGNTARLSAAYTRQSKFAGSRRQVRGAILRELATQPQTVNTLRISIADTRLADVLTELLGEGLIAYDVTTGAYSLPS